MNPIELVKLTELMELSVGRSRNRDRSTRWSCRRRPSRSSGRDYSGDCRKTAGRMRRSRTTLRAITEPSSPEFSAQRERQPLQRSAPAVPCWCDPSSEQQHQNPHRSPSATPQELAAALVETINAGARIINMSSASFLSVFQSERALEDALDYAMSRGVIVVAAAGNQAAIGSSAITRHPWVIPVVAYDLLGKPLDQSEPGRLHWQAWTWRAGR